MSKLGIVRVRGTVHIKQDIKKTLELLNLNKKNHCVIVQENPQIKGMINKTKNYITWGEIDETTENELKKAKGDVKIFKLNPPRKGYGRKGIKISFSLKGALGYRSNKMNDLIKRMI